MKKDNQEKTLTPEQEARMPMYVEKWSKIANDTTPCNRKEAEKIIKRIYKQKGLTFPNVVKWYDSPLQLKKENNIKDDKWCYGNMETFLSFYDFFLTELGIGKKSGIVHFLELAKVCGWWMPFDEAVLCCEKPVELKMKGNVLLYAKYRDGFVVNNKT